MKVNYRYKINWELGAFVWKLPVEWVVVAVQSDQLFKGIPVFLRFRSYKWIRKLT